MISIRLKSVLLAGSLLGCFAPEVRAGCDASVSATAIQLARQSQDGDDTAINVALESFAIDPAFVSAFRPALTEALRADAASDAAAAMTQALRQLCSAFAGDARVATIAPAEIAGSPASRSKQPAATGAAITQLTSRRNELDASAPPAKKGDADEPRSLGWLAREPLDRTRQQIELDVLDAKAALETVKRNRMDNDPATDDADVIKAKALFTQAEQNALTLLPNYGLFVGPNYTQNNAGGFDVGIEAYARWDSGRYYYGQCASDCTSSNPLKFGWFRGFFDASFQDTDTAAKSTGVVPDRGSGSGEGTEELDIFGREKGRLRINAGVQLHPFARLGEASDWLGFVGGVGFTAPQVIGGDDTLNRGGVRWFAGIHSVTRYRHGLGELSFGYAKDKFWNTKCAEDPALVIAGCGDFSERYFAEGMFNLVNSDATDWSLVGKISADIPTSSGGESDVVVSVMLRRDLSGYFSKLTNP